MRTLYTADEELKTCTQSFDHVIAQRQDGKPLFASDASRSPFANVPRILFRSSRDIMPRKNCTFFFCMFVASSISTKVRASSLSVTSGETVVCGSTGRTSANRLSHLHADQSLHLQTHVFVADHEQYGCLTRGQVKARHRPSR